MKSTLEVVVWADVQRILRRHMDVALEALSNCDGPRELGVQQGRIAVYREMMNLPASLVAMEEMEEAAKRDRDAIAASQDPQNWQHPFYAKGR